MPSQKILEQKKQVVAGIAEQLKGAVAGVLVNYSGIRTTPSCAGNCARRAFSMA